MWRKFRFPTHLSAIYGGMAGETSQYRFSDTLQASAYSERIVSDGGGLSQCSNLPCSSSGICVEETIGGFG